MADVVNITIVEINGCWFVEARLNGTMLHRLGARSHEEAVLIYHDVVALAQEAGGQLN